MSILLPQRRIPNVEELNDKEEVVDNVHIFLQWICFYFLYKNEYKNALIFYVAKLIFIITFIEVIRPVIKQMKICHPYFQQYQIWYLIHPSNYYNILNALVLLLFWYCKIRKKVRQSNKSTNTAFLLLLCLKSCTVILLSVVRPRHERDELLLFYAYLFHVPHYISYTNTINQSNCKRMVPSKWTMHIVNQVLPQVALSVSIVTILCTCTRIKFSSWCKRIGHTYRIKEGKGSWR